MSTHENRDHTEEERDDAVIGRALNWSLAVFAIIGVVGFGLYWFNQTEETVDDVTAPPPKPARQRQASNVAIPEFRFTDITDAAGIRFVHENGATGEKLLPETMGGGCAFLDFDNDGDPDLLFVNSSPWPHGNRTNAKPATAALYENDGKGKFTDVTAGSGLDVSFYGQGVAIGDFDNDGKVDIYFTAVGANRLFRNLGGGKFVDVTKAAGVAGADNAWGTSCGWLDYDNDGDLDLFVCNYVEWSAEFDRRQPFSLDGSTRGYGRPQAFTGAHPYLFRNDGNGRFVDASAAAKIQIADSEGRPLAKSLGVTFGDFNGDGWIDIVVANDTVQNLLFRNRGDGSFDEIGQRCNIALDNDGKPRGAMGVHAARFRNSLAIGIAVGNYSHEPTALYVTQNRKGQPLHFDDDAVSNGLGPLTEHELTFGVFFFDCDLDGRLDLLAANGHLERDIRLVDKTQSYEQPPQLLWNAGTKQDTEFLPVTKAMRPFKRPGEPADAFAARLAEFKKQSKTFDARMSEFRKPMVGRGAAFADIDGDGDLDVVIAGNGQRARLLRNDQKFGHHWLRIKLRGTKSNRDAIGAWATVKLKSGQILRQQVMPTCSYLSQIELPLTFGLGSAKKIESLEIKWPSGKTTKHAVKTVDALIEISEP